MRDWERVRKKLGRRPSRAEYVREGKYSAGTFVGRFGAWSAVGDRIHRGGAETRRKSGDPTPTRARAARSGGPGDRDIGSSGHLKSGVSRESAASRDRLTRKARSPKKPEGVTGGDAAGLIPPPALRPAAVPSELAGHRRVTELVAAMVVNTLLPGRSPFTTEVIRSTPLSQAQGRSGQATEHGGEGAGSDAITRGQRLNLTGKELAFSLRSSASSVVKKDRPVMGPPFARHPLTNAPVNEMGVVFLFGAVAWDLGFQVESLWTRGYPDGRARREVAPGKWQDVAIEFEYESKNFLRHGHDPKRCDVIVCWVHNWKECPEGIEVIELSRMFG
jgi:hypothetical protein